jgi:hypothetical protein
MVRRCGRFLSDGIDDTSKDEEKTVQQLLVGLPKEIPLG